MYEGKIYVNNVYFLCEDDQKRNLNLTDLTYEKKISLFFLGM